MPNLNVIRPADGNETNAAWKRALAETERPTMLVLTRQNLPVLDGTAENAETGVNKGAYIISEAKGDLDGIIIATGSEVELAVKAADVLTAEGKKVRVVSMPSTNRFDKQDAAYRESVLPAAVTKRVAIEAGIADFWYKYVGFEGRVVGMNSFGESAPADQLFKLFGFTVDNVVAKAKEIL